MYRLIEFYIFALKIEILEVILTVILIIQNLTIFKIYMELPVTSLSKYIKSFFPGICFLLGISFIATNCTGNSRNQTHRKENYIVENENHTVNSPLIDNEVTKDSTFIFRDSLDIRLELSEYIFIESPEKIEMKLINNSDYTVQTGSAYLLKHFEFGFWSVVPEFKRLIWTDELFYIKAKTEETFISYFDFLDLNLGKGKYQIEKEISILNTRKNTQTNNNAIIEKRFLKTEFIIK